MLANLIEQSTVADLQQTSCLLPIPPCTLERSEYGFNFYLRANGTQRSDGFISSIARTRSGLSGIDRLQLLPCIICCRLFGNFTWKGSHVVIALREICRQGVLTDPQILRRNADSSLNRFNLIALDANGERALDRLHRDDQVPASILRD